MANNDFSFDFGFSAMDADELEAVQEVKAEAQSASATASDLEDRFNKLYNMVIPLLNNLKKNPEKDYIYWPNRLERVESFEDHISSIIA